MPPVATFVDLTPDHVSTACGAWFDCVQEAIGLYALDGEFHRRESTRAAHGIVVSVYVEAFAAEDWAEGGEETPAATGRFEVGLSGPVSMTAAEIFRKRLGVLCGKVDVDDSGRIVRGWWDEAALNVPAILNGGAR